MTSDDHSPKGFSKKARHPYERCQDPRGTASAARSWTSKTMHHPATRIGEIKHGK